LGRIAELERELRLLRRENDWLLERLDESERSAFAQFCASQKERLN
jgi:hypothetical protein